MHLKTDVVRARLVERQLSVISLCRSAGLNYQRIIQLLNGGYGLKLRDREARAIAEVLKLPPPEVRKGVRG